MTATIGPDRHSGSNNRRQIELEEPVTVRPVEEPYRDVRPQYLRVTDSLAVSSKLLRFVPGVRGHASPATGGLCPVGDPSTGLSESARGKGRGHAKAYSAARGQNTATRRYLRQPRIVLQGVAATLTGGFAVFIDHPAAVLGAAAILSSPLASEFLVNGKALRVTEVDFAVGADIRGHEALSLGQTAGRQRLSNSRLRRGSLTG